MRVMRLLVCGFVFSVLMSVVPAVAQTPKTPPGQEEFVPLSEIPPEEQIPAFTLVAAAYAAVWVVLVGYVWSVSRRLNAVEHELTSIARKRS